MATQCGYLTHNINLAYDGQQQPIHDLISVETATAAYKTYEGTLTGDLEIDCETDLGRYNSAGYVANDGLATGLEDFTVALDPGSGYGDEITIKPGEKLELLKFFPVKKIRITHSSNTNYRVLAR